MRLPYQEKICFLLFCALLSIFDVQAQPFAIGKTTITFTDGSRNNRAIETDIYYPASQSGTNVPVAGGSNIRFPVICIGHGFVMAVDAYANLWNMLVPEGYIVALPKTESSFSPSHANFGRDLAFVIDTITQLNDKSNSIFFNKVDNMNCVMGHSMGGGAAHLAAAGNAKIKAIATFAAAETNPSAIGAAGTLQIPALVFAGSNDCVTPPANHQTPIYNALKSNCKTYLTIKGGSHCQMAESNFNCNFGEATCTPAPSISRIQQHAVIKSYLIPWLQYQLKQDCNAARAFDNLMKNDNNVSFQNNCTFCLVSQTAEVSLFSNNNVYPNPFKETLNITSATRLSGPVHITLKSVDGKVYRMKEEIALSLNNGSWQMQTGNLTAGIYILQLQNAEKTETYKLIKAN
jgi:predicted dienelactone hydrolase